MFRRDDMSNKMQKYFLLWFILLIYNGLHSFVPRERDFSNQYQYRMHQSWIEKGEFKANVPAGFAADHVTKIFRDSLYQVQVEYKWEDWKIYEQREIISNFIDFDYHDVLQQFQFLEIFVYRLNCADAYFLQDIYKPEYRLIYQDFDQESALDSLIQDYSKHRFNVSKVIVNSKDNRIGFKVTSSDQQTFEIYFPEAKNLQVQLQELRLVETIREQELQKLKEKVKIWKEEQEFETKQHEIASKNDAKATLLIDYIRKNFDKHQQKELLHNKIIDPEAFIYKEFSRRNIQKDKNIYSIKNRPFLEKFRSDIQIKTLSSHDGIDIRPVSHFQIQDKKIEIGTGEAIDLSKLNDQEIEKIAPFLCQMIYEHRAIGTELLNFLLIHDDTPSTLVVHTSKRELFEMYSYANMILMLHHYWNGKEVFFSVKDFKKVNGYIEFTGYLAAVSNQQETYDFAEIKYQLNHQFRIQLAMMILYPELSTIE